MNLADSVRPSDTHLTRESLRIAASLGPGLGGISERR